MPLPWVRLDCNIAQHDKVLRLLNESRDPKRWQAFTVFVCGLGWSGGAGTDGRIPDYALAAIHGTPQVARLLVAFELWEEAPDGWQVHNWAKYQQTEAVTRAKSEAASRAAITRWHGPAAAERRAR